MNEYFKTFILKKNVLIDPKFDFVVKMSILAKSE